MDNELAQYTVLLRADVDGLKKEIANLKTTLPREAETASKSFASKFKTGMIAAGLSVGVIVLALRKAIIASIDSAKAFAGVNQAVKQTGMAAGFTSEKLQQISKDLSKLSGIDDDEILKGVTKQLLTFTQISGESFTRAQKAVLDLNAVINEGAIGGLTSQSIQLGKALENPIAGIGALSRAGVTFSDKQKEMIRGFMQQNNIMAAQNVILTEIEAKYGGQAEAMNDVTEETQNLAVEFGNLQEAVGDFVTPFLGVIIPSITKGIRGLITLMQNANDEFRKLLKIGSGDRQTSWYETLKGSSKEYRDSEKKRIEEEIELNKKLWQKKEKQVGFFKTKETTQAWQDQKGLNALNASLKDYLAAIDKYDKDSENTAKNLNQKWDVAGKTFGEISDRVDFLKEQLVNFEPGSIDATKFKKEIDKLSSILGDKKEIEIKVYSPEDVKAKHIGIDKDSWEREKKIMFENTDLMKLKRGELALYMKEVNQETLDNSKFTNEAIFLDWIEKNKGIQDTFDVMRDISMRAFDEIRIRASSNASAIENMFIDMGNIVLNKLKEIAAQWLAMSFLRLIFGVATGGASMAAHSGGEFIGTPGGVKKLAGGGSFIVPPGFPNDSYPLLVESGERVSVNSASNVGLQDRHLSNISKKLDGLAILNSNFLESTMSKPRQQAIPIYGKIEGPDIYLANKRATKIIRRLS